MEREVVYVNHSAALDQQPDAYVGMYIFTFTLVFCFTCSAQPVPGSGVIYPQGKKSSMVETLAF